MPSSPGTSGDAPVVAPPGAAAPAEQASSTPRLVVRVSPWSITRGVLLLAVVALVLAMMNLASTTLWWIAIAATIAGLLLPLVNRLDRHVPRWLAIVVVLVGFTAFGGFVVGRGLVELNNQITAVRDSWVDQARSIEVSERFGTVATEFGLADKVQSLFDAMPFYFTGDSAELLQTTASSAGALVVVGFFILLLVISGRRFYFAALDQLEDEGARRRIRLLVSTAYREATGYLGWMAARAVGYGVATALVTVGVGGAAPTVIGLWFGAWSLVPGLGLVLAALPIAIGLSVSSLHLGALVLVAATLAQVLDSRFLQRRIDAGTVAVGPALTLLAGVFGLILYGAGGFLVVLFAIAMVLALLQGLEPYGPDLLIAGRALRGRPPGPDAEPLGVAPPP